MRSDPFQQTEQQYLRLRGRLAAGRLTREQFQARLKELVLQDEQGRYWMLGTDTGKWFVHNGQQWVEATPPAAASLLPQNLPERSLPPVLIEKPAPLAAATLRRSNFTLVLALGLALVFVVAIGLLAYALARPTQVVLVAPNGLGTTPTLPAAYATSPSGLVPPSGTLVPVLAESQSQALLTRQEFLANNDTLAAAIADLNRAELKFIQDAHDALALNSPPRILGWAFPLSPAPDVPLLDGDLREIAARGMQVGNLAEALGQTAAAQDKGSEAAGSIASQYFGLAQLGYALVIETQNMRDELNRGEFKFAEWNNCIADYGTRLWNPRVTDAPEGSPPMNPFIANHPQPASVPPVKFMDSDGAAAVKTQLGSRAASVQSWLATTQDSITQTLSVPAPLKPVANSFDSNLLSNLSQAAGQSDGDTARQVAATHLDSLAPSTGKLDSGSLQVALPTGMVMADRDLAAGSVLPFYDRGAASVLAKPSTGSEEEAVDSLFHFADKKPKVQAQVPIMPQSSSPVLLNLSLTQQERTHPGSSELYTVHFILSWEIPELVHPNFSITCSDAEPGRITANTSSGQQRVTMRARVGFNSLLCAAYGWGGFQQMGYAFLPFDVGSKDEMTQEASAYETKWARVQATNDAERRKSMTGMVATVTALAMQTRTAEAAKATSEAVGKEVGGTQTAEFHATITQIAAMTKQASRATAAAAAQKTQEAIAGNVFAMNGTFNLSFGGDPYVGPIKLSVDLNTGKASAFFQAESGFKYQDKCDPSATRSSHAYFEGNLDGTVNAQTGELSKFTGPMKGTANNEGDCGTPGVKVNLAPVLSLSGVIDLKSHTAKGRIACVEVGCDGDWHAGQ